MSNETGIYSSLVQDVLDHKVDISQVRGQLSVASFKRFKQEYLLKLGESLFEHADIANEIFKKLDMTDLKKFRQVNKFCYKASKNMWLSKTWICIRNNIVTSHETPLQKFTRFFQKFVNPQTELGIPVENFTLSLTGAEVGTTALGTFKWICGPHIKSLKIEFSDVQFEPTPDEAIARIFNAEFDLKNLKRLHLIVDQPLRFHLLFSKVANLEELLVGKSDWDSSVDFSRLLSDLWLYRIIWCREADCMELTTLDTIGVPIFDSESIIRAKFPLRHLALRLPENSREVELAKVLMAYRIKLRSVKLIKSKIRLHTPFVNLPLDEQYGFNLEELELWGNVVTNLDLLRKMNGLMKLKIDYGCFKCPYFSGYVTDEPNVFQGDMIQNSSRQLLECKYFRLLNLEVFETDCKMSSESWNILTKWMPNLRVLEAPIPDNTVFWIVCDHLENLEKIRVRFGSQVDDDGIVGRSSDISRSRGITKLKYLRSFELEVECGQGRITDRSAELGFLKLQYLRYLKLGFSGNLLTEEMEARLRERIRHFEMYRSCKNTTADGEMKRCCEWADFKRDWRLV